MTKRRRKFCHECGGSHWGLIRHYWGLSAFCTKLCLERFKERHERQRTWLKWLHDFP